MTESIIVTEFTQHASLKTIKPHYGLAQCKNGPSQYKE